ncbi:MAG: exodeoxyribonuclease VII large subunit [Kiritimatiellae bacterium]|nr:exodeoxyribonuclease VII large subunit [Kiritimatiellia bacterium]
MSDLFSWNESAPAPPEPAGQGPRIFTVAELNAAAASALQNAIGEVWVEGEISNLRDSDQRHLYFTLKDAHAAIDAVMFRSSRLQLPFTPDSGQRVVARGELSIYAPRGRYQIVVRLMRLSGRGDLFEAFERLKRSLAAKGWFDRKRPIPLLPRRIGVATSPHGAAIRDILNVLARRCPSVPVLIAPCRVQGEGAADEVAAAIRRLNDPALGVDTILVARGGGSIEELWPFNEERLARAVFESALPVISGVGHETDFTICDFVADVRAPTPSAAAECAVPDRAELARRLAHHAARLRASVRNGAERVRARVQAAAAHRVFHEPRAIAARYRERVAHFDHRARSSMRRTLEVRLQQTDEHRRVLRSLFSQVAAARVEAVSSALAAHTARLRSLNPRAVLKRGYTLTTDETGHPLRSVAAVRAGARLVTEWPDGRVRSVVSEIIPTAPPDGEQGD